MSYVFLDIETSGLNPQYHEVIEVGYVMEDGHEVEFSLPFSEQRASAEALQVNGWGTRPFAPLLDPREARGLLQDDLDGVYLVGQQTYFDAMFLKHFLNEAVWNFRLVELSSLVAGAVGIMPPMKSEQIMEFTGIQNPDRHGALADARWNKKVFEWFKDRG